MEEETVTMENPEVSEILDFYKGQSIFITGGTGFVGICLIEKILRSIPSVDKIYMLLRPKKGKSIADRLEELKKNSVFEVLRKDGDDSIFNKLVPIAGEISDENLGISEEDRNTLIQNVNIVFHSAASLDFGGTFKSAIDINLIGTRQVTELCKEMKNLKILVHVSSAYVNSFIVDQFIDEKLYPVMKDVEEIIHYAKSLPEDALNALEPKLLGSHPNSYTFTKHFAEHEVGKCASLFPCAIVRPSQITVAWKEPRPGWTISKNGPSGFLLGASRGVVRRLPISTDLISDYIPVDIVVNQLLAAGMYTYKKRSELKEVKIYHATTSHANPFRWRLLKDRINNNLRAYPVKNAAWYPHLKFVDSILRFKIASIFAHFIPALFLDAFTFICGGKPILLKLHKNVWNSLSRLEHFIFIEFVFRCDNRQVLSNSLKSKDREIFSIDITTLLWEDYFQILQIGVREYLNNDPLTTLNAAKRRQKILKYFHYTFKALLMFIMWSIADMIHPFMYLYTMILLPFFWMLLNAF